MSPTSTESYIELLEKTNQQLSLWYNPYGLMIATLTLLVALLAIYFAYILWRQGRDYKDFLEAQKKALSEETRLYAKAVLDERIAKLNIEMESLAGKARERVEKEIVVLQEAGKSINVQPSLQKSLSYHIRSRSHNPLGEALKRKMNSGLNENQIRAILSLLQSFGASAETIQDVETSLRS